jgi:hypothetical protein
LFDLIVSHDELQEKRYSVFALLERTLPCNSLLLNLNNSYNAPQEKIHPVYSLPVNAFCCGMQL